VILLSSTADKIQVVTSAVGAIDVHTNWADLASGVVTVGRQNSKIVTAATTDIVPSPAASTARSVKGINIQNIHATVSNTVTVNHTDGTNVVQLEVVTLAPGERIAYSDEGGTGVYDTAGRLKIPGLGLPAGNANTSDVVANAADTYLTGSSLPVAGRVQAGSYFRWSLRATKTAAGTATPAFNIRFGTAGTVADTARVLLTSTAAGTAVADTGVFEIDGRFESVGATAVFEAWVRMDHTSADAIGFGTFRYITTQSASFDVTPAGTIIGLSCNPGATGTPVWTFQSVLIDAGNLLS
jgi:hypothetical protein